MGIKTEGGTRKPVFLPFFFHPGNYTKQCREGARITQTPCFQKNFPVRVEVRQGWEDRHRRKNIVASGRISKTLFLNVRGTLWEAKSKCLVTTMAIARLCWGQKLLGVWLTSENQNDSTNKESCQLAILAGWSPSCRKWEQRLTIVTNLHGAYLQLRKIED